MRGSLTVLDVIKHNELLPAQLLHQHQHHVVQAHRRSGRQCVALASWARVELAGRPGRSLAVPLDEKVWYVHSVRQRLQGAG